ncbi:hypothetical protein CANTEDRAFT_106295 [Yamadazyma tenuis ATCC 10573]|uniref:Cation-transporting P-type ATPase N-terminal domain-containing protein n=2 Tax=Candida tenuis TaxID=2315449 RepID=G3B581_CANTC|nr:uncharacterized protein CANTEDRAFT_106295 [Yamadazyma tenuis ATCC 10573]EGV63158.1 hypothetical protein CANTEDRAFT_106295 [Yamadazyma tenuis ATCC 10573]
MSEKPSAPGQTSTLALPANSKELINHDLASINSQTPLTDTYSLSISQLSELHDPKSLRKLIELGGLDNLSNILNSDVSRGISDSDDLDMKQRTKHYGDNRLPVKVQKSFLRLCIEAFKDKVLILLTVAAVVSMALGLYETFGTDTMYDVDGTPIPKLDWVEGVAIIVAVLIVVLVGAANDYQKERQFAKLNAKKEDRELIVVRNGQQVLVSIYDLVVGDVINLQTGDVVPADSVLVSGEVECDESALTGESDTIHKRPADEALEFYKLNASDASQDLGSVGTKFKDPFLISGAKILSGLGNALVTAVGVNSIHGRTMMSLNHESESTPLQERLDNLADGISKYGFLAALVLFIVLFIRFCIKIAPGGSDNDLASAEKGKKFLDILITAITIIVVAVPEGLPLAVTLALAFATTRMAQNGNLVRVLKSCETMGGATAVCSDKTGTLTENKMRIVKGYFGNGMEFDDMVSNKFGPKSLEIIPSLFSDLKTYFATNITLNSTAFKNVSYNEEAANILKTKPKKKNFFQRLFESMSDEDKIRSTVKYELVSDPYLGNKTESALLIFAKDKLNLFENEDLEQIRKNESHNIVQTIPFESSRKWSGIIVKIENGYRFYFKGAAEIVVRNCGFKYDENNQLARINRDDRDVILGKIDEFANDALRAIAVGHQDFVGATSWPLKSLINEQHPAEADPEKLVDTSPAVYDESKRNLILDCIVGIQDPLKPGVPEAVLKCKEGGVSVRMVTGDNLRTAKAISQGCYILTPEDLDNEHASMEGPYFRKLSEAERIKVVPHLRVLARSSPEDKRILVDTLRKSGEVVAVTGDGTNDASALKLADVGFSMGISGTEVAREASDIILMTDDFTDIVQAIKWGRTVAVSIKKFIQFQLTVNITAVVLTFVSAVASSDNHSVLTAVQLLWVNLIMDTLAALALATDKPDDSFLKNKPAGRTAPLISVSMWKMILGQSTTQLAVTLTLHFGGQKLFYGDAPVSSHQLKQLDSLTFNTFVWLQVWKLVVTRKLDEAADITTIRGRITAYNLNFFSHLFRNWYFLIITIMICAVQVLIMFVGGASFSIARLTPGMWATSIICGFVSIPAGLIIRIMPNTWAVKIFPTKAFGIFIYYVGFNFLKKSKKEDLEANV